MTFGLKKVKLSKLLNFFSKLLFTKRKKRL